MVSLRLAIKFYEDLEQKGRRLKVDREDDEDEGDQPPSGAKPAEAAKPARSPWVVFDKMRGFYSVQELCRMERSKFYSLFGFI